MTSPHRTPPTVAALVIACAALTTVSLQAQKINTASDGLALQGYDLVAYFVEGRPTKGDASFSHRIGPTTYRFHTAANRDLFAADPDRYLPQFGGFCAYAVSRNYTADVDPLAWKIVDDKLYLNYSRRAQERWEADVPGNIARGNTNWPGLGRK